MGVPTGVTVPAGVSDADVGFIVPRAGTADYVVGLGQTFSLLDWDSGKTTVIAEVDDTNKRTRVNDGKCDASGRLWAGQRPLLAESEFII